jgi:hypothetical protein
VLAAVAGVDLSPFAAAIARFRLLVAALRVCGVRALRNAPDFNTNIAVGDSLLHSPRRDRLDVGSASVRVGLEHVYATEDADDLRRILGRQYHVVVANPPYITPKDPALNQAYRDRFDACRGQYALTVPFMQLLFDLAAPIEGLEKHAGFVGQITANSFMRREFGKSLVEQHLSRLDLSLVVDTSGAYIPGHGTPTVILVGRNRAPVTSTVRTVMGILGEPQTPPDPARGIVWTAILNQVDRPGSQSAYASVEDIDRARLSRHPWSISGGGASDLRERIEAIRDRLADNTESVGFASFPGADEVFVVRRGDLERSGVDRALVRDFVTGESVRDWAVEESTAAFVPYDEALDPIPAAPDAAWWRRQWPYRAVTAATVGFGGRTRSDLGEPWWTWYRWIPSKYRTELSITFASVATHNHFALDRGGKVFKQSAPVIKLRVQATEDEHLGLLGL